MRSMVTDSALAGPSDAATNASGSSDHGTMSTCSVASSLRIARWRTPLGPTQAPTGSRPGCVEETPTFVRNPGSRAIARTWTVPALISGTSASSSRCTKTREARDTLTCAWRAFRWAFMITTSTGLPGCSCAPGICSSGGITPSARPRSTYTVPISMRSTMPLASSPLCSATSRSTLSRSRSWMCRNTACFAVWAAIRLKSSDGSISTISLPSGRTTRLRTSRAPVLVSSFTLTSPAGLKARVYAPARATSTVCSISSKGMPTSAHSAVSASARLSVTGSECDREPARDNVTPCDVQNDGCATARTLGLHGYAGAVDGDQLTLDHRIRITTPIADVDSLAVEPLVVGAAAQRALGAWRRDLEVVRPIDEIGVVDQWTRHPAHPLAVLDGDRLGVVDRDAKRATRVARLLERVQLVTHVFERGFDQLCD